MVGEVITCESLEEPPEVNCHIVSQNLDVGKIFDCFVDLTLLDN